MKLEYFYDAFEGRGLLLLYGDSTAEVESLRAAVRKLTVAGTNIALHDLDFIEPVGGCQLTAASACACSSAAVPEL